MLRILALLIGLLPAIAGAACPTFAAGDTSYIAKLNQLSAGCVPTTGDAALPRAAAGGSANAITATFSPAITLTDKTIVAVVAGAANSTSTPTFAPNGLTAHTITKNGNAALAAGDIAAAGHVVLLEYNLAGTRWELLNPAVTGVGTVTAVSVATANGVSGSSSGGATPALTIALGAITPTTVNGLTVGTGLNTSSSDTALGNSTLPSNTGTYSTAVGYQALNANLGGNGNTGIGADALLANTTGSTNTALGLQAGWGAAGTNANTTGSNNLYLGYATVGSAVGNSNEIVIGASAVGLGTNNTVIGNSSTTAAKIWGDLTISGTFAATQLSGTIAAARMPALAGDCTTSVGAVAVTCATVNGNVGTFGSATKSTTQTVNAKGFTTAISEQTVTPAVGSITGLGAGVGTALAAATGSAGGPVIGGAATSSGLTMATAKLLCRTTASSGAIEECTAGTGLTLSAGSLAASGGGSGTVTHTGGALAANAVVLGAGTDDTKVVAGIATDGASALNLGVAGASTGTLVLAGATSGTSTITVPATAAGTLRHGAADAASPVAQTLQVQSVAGGTSNAAGVDWTQQASLSTGSGAAGNQTIKTGFAGRGALTTTVTVTIAAPGVFTWTAHGFVPGHPVVFTTSGALPTGITASTTYYVVNDANLAANTFTVAATPGGAAITTTGSQSGTHTGTASATVQNPAMAVATWGPSGVTGAQTTPALTIAQAWNTSSNPVILRLAASNTASTANSSTRFISAQGGPAGTTDVFHVDASGAITTTVAAQSTTGLSFSATNASFDNSIFFGSATRAGNGAFKFLDLRANSVVEASIDGAGGAFFNGTMGIGAALSTTTGLTIGSANVGANITGVGQSSSALAIANSHASFDNSLIFANTTRAANSAFKLLDLRANSVAQMTVDGAGAMAATSLTTTGLIKSSGTAGIGYATGAGGTVTQATSRATGVTLSKASMVITTDSTSLAALTAATFTVTNTLVAITDVVACSEKSGATNVTTDVRVTATAAGSFNLTVHNLDPTTAEVGAIVINCVLIKGVSS